MPPGVAWRASRRRPRCIERRGWTAEEHGGARRVVRARRGHRATGWRSACVTGRGKLRPVRLRPSLSWLWLLVAVQVAIPASYYLVREDADDERFAWRMFSAVRLK